MTTRWLMCMMPIIMVTSSKKKVLWLRLRLIIRWSLLALVVVQTFGFKSEVQGKRRIAPHHKQTRRSTLETIGGSAFLVVSQTTLARPHPSWAASPVDAPSIVSPREVLTRLRRVPVYAIVDGEGTPFATYDPNSATANCYFFLAVDNAKAVLDDARQAYEQAKDRRDDVADSWGNSRIVALSLDFAMRLTVNTQAANVAQNGKSFKTAYQVLPSAVSIVLLMYCASCCSLAFSSHSLSVRLDCSSHSTG